jgi:hypothetical protein
MSVPTAAGGPAPWWLAYPDVREAEAAALAAVGATWSRRSTRGQAEQLAPGADLGPRLALRISWPHPAPQPGDPDRLELLVRYPTSYPWFPPRVYLPEPLPGLVRHRNATNHGALCLLAVDDDWQPGATVAELLTVQLPRLLAAGRDPRTYPATLGLEAGAEPTWTRLVLVRGALLVDSACTPARRGPRRPGRPGVRRPRRQPSARAGHPPGRRPARAVGRRHLPAAGGRPGPLGPSPHAASRTAPPLGAVAPGMIASQSWRKPSSGSNRASARPGVVSGLGSWRGTWASAAVMVSPGGRGRTGGSAVPAPGQAALGPR